MTHLLSALHSSAGWDVHTTFRISCVMHLGPTGRAAADVRLIKQRPLACFSCSRHTKSPHQHTQRWTRKCRFVVDAKKKGRPAARAAEVEAEKPAGVQEHSDAASPVASEPIADTVASTSASEEQAVQEVQMSISEEDLKTLKAAIRTKQTGDGQGAGLLEGILEEVRLISWPNPVQALSDTLVVIAIVGGTAVTLFFVNSILADISRQIY